MKSPELVTLMKIFKMETNQQTQVTAVSSSVKRSSFGPGSISFLVGVLLFLLPFVDIKCGGTTIKEVKGFELATGFTIEDKNSKQSLFGNMGVDQTISNSKSEKREPNIFALAALGLGILGFIVTLLTKGRSIIASLFGVLASVALIALMIDIKSDSKLNTAPNGNNNLDGLNSNFGNDIIRAEFTPWIYLTIIVFLLAAYFSWQKKKKPVESTTNVASIEQKPAG